VYRHRPVVQPRFACPLVLKTAAASHITPWHYATVTLLIRLWGGDYVCDKVSSFRPGVQVEPDALDCLSETPPFSGETLPLSRRFIAEPYLWWARNYTLARRRRRRRRRRFRHSHSQALCKVESARRKSTWRRINSKRTLLACKKNS
jgi:hypothetical protein